MKRCVFVFVLVFAVASAAFGATQSIPGTAGLDRIDQRQLPLDHGYTFNELGSNTTIYIVDSGVDPNSELGSRLLPQINFVAGEPQDVADLAQHGTHVAILAAGSVHGVARGARIQSLKVTIGSTHSVSSEAVVAALKHIRKYPPAGPAVVNLSFAISDLSIFPTNWRNEIRAAVQELLTFGIPVVTVARDGNCPAAYVPEPTIGNGGGIAVSGIHLNDSTPTADGGCVDIFAPDQNESSTGTFNDVSSAAPLVSGAVALLQERTPQIAFNPAELKATLLARATRDVLHLPAGSVSPNLLLFTLPNVGITAPPQVPAQTTFTATVSSGAGPGSTYLWTVNGGTIVSGGTSSSVNVQAGYGPTVTLQVVVDGPAGRSSGMASVGVTPVPITMPSSANVGETFTASVTPVSGATYSWSAGGATVLSGGATPTATIRAGCGNSLTVSVLVSAPSGGGVGSRSMVLARSTATLTGSTYINPGGSAQLRVDLTGTGPWTLNWSDGVQQTVTASPAFRNVSPLTTQTYTLTVSTNNCNGTAYGSAEVTVGDCMPVSNAMSVPASAYSSATVMASTITADEGAYYYWSLANATTNWFEGPNNYLSFKMGCIGASTVYVEINQACGMQVHGSASIPIVQSNANVSGSNTITAGQQTTIRADYTGTLPWSIRWSDGVWQYNILSAWVTRKVTPSATTTYTAVEVRDPSWCLGTASGSAAITVH